jgi:hypothetical protein
MDASSSRDTNNSRDTSAIAETLLTGEMLAKTETPTNHDLLWKFTKKIIKTHKKVLKDPSKSNGF